MTTVNISQGFAHYSPNELINYANNGVLFADSVELSEFVEYLVEQEELKYTEEHLDNAYEEGYREGIRRCIGSLEDL